MILLSILYRTSRYIWSNDRTIGGVPTTKCLIGAFGILYRPSKYESLFSYLFLSFIFHGHLFIAFMNYFVCGDNFELSEISFKWLGNHFELLNCLKLVPKPLWLSVWNFMTFPQILYRVRAWKKIYRVFKFSAVGGLSQTVDLFLFRVR